MGDTTQSEVIQLSEGTSLTQRGESDLEFSPEFAELFKKFSQQYRLDLWGVLASVAGYIFQHNESFFRKFRIGEQVGETLETLEGNRILELTVKTTGRIKKLVINPGKDVNPMS